MRIALLGNPNSGKSTLFTAITGKEVHTGNWPGKTVEIFWKTFKIGNKDYTLFDLPGVYRLEGRNTLEKAVEKFFEETSPEVAIVLVDPRAFSFSMPIFKFLKNRKVKILIAFNFADELSKEELKALAKIIQQLKLPAVIISARNRQGIKALINAINSAEEISDAKLKALEKELKRFERKRLSVLDKLLLKKPLAFLYLLVFSLSLFVLPVAISQGFEPLFSLIPAENPLINAALSALIFLPVVFSFYFVFSFLEDTGLLARASMAFSYLLSMPGTPVFPFLMATGCNVLGVEASKLLKGKIRTKFCTVVPLIPCSTRLAVLAVLLSTAGLFRAFKLLLVYLLAFFGFIFIFFWKDVAKKPDFVELPPIRRPSFAAIIDLSLKRTWVFAARVLPWIFVGFILAEFLKTSMHISCAITKVFIPLSLVLSFFAKEALLGTIQSCFGSFDIFSILNGFASAYILFFMFYLPCFPTLVAIYRECGRNTAVKSIAVSLTAGIAAAAIGMLVG